MPSHSQREWEREESFRRIFAALSNVLTDAELREILRGYLDLVGLTDEVEAEVRGEIHPSEFYFVLHLAIARTENGAVIWATYVRSVHPKAPKGLSEVGLPANGPKHKQSDSIRIERQQKLPPGAHDSSCDMNLGED